MKNGIGSAQDRDYWSDSEVLSLIFSRAKRRLTKYFKNQFQLQLEYFLSSHKCRREILLGCRKCHGVGRSAGDRCCCKQYERQEVAMVTTPRDLLQSQYKP